MIGGTHPARLRSDLAVGRSTSNVDGLLSAAAPPSRGCTSGPELPPFGATGARQREATLSREPALSTNPPSWHPDPLSWHQYRYWDGRIWTDHVADHGVQSRDPLSRGPRPPEEASERPGGASSSGSAVPPDTTNVGRPDHATASTVASVEASDAGLTSKAKAQPSHDDVVAADDGSADFASAQQLEQSGDVEQASERYRAAIRLGHRGAPLSLGLLRRRMGDLAGAEAAYAIGEALGDTYAICNLAGLLMDRGDLDGAEASYRRADALNFVGGAYGLGQVLFKRGDIAGAIAANRRAMTLGDGDAAYNLGVLLEQQGDSDGAEAAFRTGHGLGHISSSLAWGRILEDNGDLDEAETLYRQADDQGDANGTFGLASVLYKKGHEAVAQTTMIRARDRGHEGARTYLRVLEETGDTLGSSVDPVRSRQLVHDLAATCQQVLQSYDSCIKSCAMHRKAQNVAAMQQHPMSRDNFSREAAGYHSELVGRLANLAGAQNAARDLRAQFLAASGTAQDSMGPLLMPLLQSGEITSEEASSIMIGSLVSITDLGSDVGQFEAASSRLQEILSGRGT